MNSILDAIDAARLRNKQRDEMNAARRMTMPTMPTQTIQPITYLQNDDKDGYGAGVQDTRTPHEQYLDAVDFSGSIGSKVPVLGTVGNIVSDAYITKYERENPDKVVGGTRQSYLGRLYGSEYTPQELSQGGVTSIWDRVFGKPEEQQRGYGFFDRLFDTTPRFTSQRMDYIGSFPRGSDSGGRDDGSIGGYSRGSLSYDSATGPTGVA